MPTGVYKRTPELMKEVRKNLDKGRTPKVRKKVAKILKENAKDPKWREKVSEATKKSMHDPEIRKRHLAGLEKAREKYGNSFKGGNGQPMTPIVELANNLLSQCGYIREYPIRTKTVRNIFKNVATAYKADFANPDQMIVIELDGASHLSMKQKKTDEKKDKILKALGWTVIRLSHCSR